MLRYAVSFLVIAIIAAVLGFSGIARVSGSIAWILAIVYFVVLVVASLLFGRRARL